MNISFERNKWNPEDFTRVTSLRTDGRDPMIQEDDCIVNETCQHENIFEHKYISMLYKDEYKTRTRFKTECSFDKYGAPLIVFTDDLIQTEDGFPAYRHHFEVVVFEEGWNLWELNGKDKPILAASARFPVPEKEYVTLEVSTLPGGVSVSLLGHTQFVELPTFPKTFRAGITACEGINRFRCFCAEE